MSDPDEDRTDPNIVMPSGPATDEIELTVDDVAPSAPPPPPPPPPAPKAPLEAKPFPKRSSTLPPRARPLSSARKLDAKPPTGLRARPAEKAPERQRFAQMQTQLDEARSSVARQRHELDELRTQLDDKERRIEEMLAELKASGGREALDEKLRELDERGDAHAEELRARLEQLEREGPSAELEARVKDLEEGTEISRIRMRVERAGHQLREALERLGAVEASQRELSARLESHERNAKRLDGLESLFAELAEEVREQRDGRDVDELRARLSDVEALTLDTGSELKKLSESIVPPPRAPLAEDLTKIKGIGPKYAKQLAAIGVTKIRQVAAWTDGDIERVAMQLGIKAARIRKAGWVESARSLVGA